MQLSAERTIDADVRTVFAALNNTAILRQSLPGCEYLEKTGDDEMTARVKLKIGPVAATFGGIIKLSDLDPPHGYTISGEGAGGAAGFAKGSATVKLIAHNGGTLLQYTVRAQVGGKLAQLGARLIDGAAKKLAAQFFDAFAAQLRPSPPAAITPAAGHKTAKRKTAWIVVAAAAALLALWLLLSVRES